TVHISSISPDTRNTETAFFRNKVLQIKLSAGFREAGKDKREPKILHWRDFGPVRRKRHIFRVHKLAPTATGIIHEESCRRDPNQAAKIRRGRKTAVYNDLFFNLGKALQLLQHFRRNYGLRYSDGCRIFHLRRIIS